MAQHYSDLNDFLAPLSSKGISVVRGVHHDPASREVDLPGRYLDPVTGRLSALSEAEYYRHPIETYQKGRADFIYSGQKKGKVSVRLVDIHKIEDEKRQSQATPASSGWRELKIWEPTAYKKQSCYTNLPAQY